MKSIKVFIYSYKNKNLLEQIKDIVAKSGDGVSITYYVYDQNNVDRSFHFKEFSGVVYKFVQWDDYKSITHYRNLTILNGNPAEYFLEINANITLIDNWANYLISAIKNRTVISGQGKTILNVSGGKLLSSNFISNKVEENNYLDMDLIFLKLKHAMALLQLKMLKHLGQELLGSIIFLKDAQRIYSLPTGSYVKIDQENIDTYVPYSKLHGYNKMLDFILKFDNSLFQEIHEVRLDQISKLKYEINDVQYNSYDISIENLDQPRFLNGYSGIQIS